MFAIASDFFVGPLIVIQTTQNYFKKFSPAFSLACDVHVEDRYSLIGKFPPPIYDCPNICTSSCFARVLFTHRGVTCLKEIPLSYSWFFFSMYNSCTRTFFINRDLTLLGNFHLLFTIFVHSSHTEIKLYWVISTSYQFLTEYS